jgi:hypothetical protein
VGDDDARVATLELAEKGREGIVIAGHARVAEDEPDAVGWLPALGAAADTERHEQPDQ